MLVDIDRGAVDRLGGARVGERVGLRHLLVFRNADRQVALGDRDGADADVLAHHDDTRLLVDNDARDLIRLDAELLDIGQKRNRAARIGSRNRQPDRARIDRPGGIDPKETVDCLRNAARGGEIGVTQRNPDVGQPRHIEQQFAFDDAAIRDAPACGYTLCDRAGIALGGKSADGKLSLGDRIDFAVRADHRRHQQGAAEQAFGIAERRDRHVDPRALPGEGGQGGGNHHRGDIGGLQRIVAGIDAEAFEHADQAVLRKCGIGQGVAGPVQADDQSVSHQQVFPDAFKIGDILYARLCGGPERRQHHRKRHCGCNDGGESTSQAPFGGREKMTWAWIHLHYQWCLFVPLLAKSVPV